MQLDVSTITRRMLVCYYVSMILLLFPSVLYAENIHAIVVLNSDTSIEKYATAQNSFKTVISQAILEVNVRDIPEIHIKKLLQDKHVRVIYCIGTTAYSLARRYAKEDVMLVFSSLLNWRRFALSDTTYGVTNELHSGQELSIFRSIFPDVQTIGVLYSQHYTQLWFENAHKEAQEMNIDLLGMEIGRKETTIVLEELLQHVDAFWLIADPEVISSQEEVFNIFEICNTHNIPVFSFYGAFADLGAVLTLSVDAATVGRQAAHMVTKLLAEKTLEEKVQFPAGTYQVHNCQKIKEYGGELLLSIYIYDENYGRAHIFADGLKDCPDSRTLDLDAVQNKIETEMLWLRAETLQFAFRATEADR